MIDIDFVNLILIIADHVSDSEKPENPYFYVLGAPGNPRRFTSVMFGSPRLSALDKSSDPNNFMTDFLADVLSNPFGNFSMDISSNLAVDLVLSPAVFSLSNLPTLGWFL